MRRLSGACVTEKTRAPPSNETGQQQRPRVRAPCVRLHVLRKPRGVNKMTSLPPRPQVEVRLQSSVALRRQPPRHPVEGRGCGPFRSRVRARAAAAARAPDSRTLAVPSGDYRRQLETHPRRPEAKSLDESPTQLRSQNYVGGRFSGFGCRLSIGFCVFGIR